MKTYSTQIPVAKNGFAVWCHFLPLKKVGNAANTFGLFLKKKFKWKISYS